MEHRTSNRRFERGTPHVGNLGRGCSVDPDQNPGPLKGRCSPLGAIHDRVLPEMYGNWLEEYSEYSGKVCPENIPKFFIPLQCEAPKIAKLVKITPITMVYSTYNYSYWGFSIPKFFIPLVNTKDMYLKVDRPKRRRKWSGAAPHLEHLTWAGARKTMAAGPKYQL